MKQVILLSMVLSAGLWGVGSLYGTKVLSEHDEKACVDFKTGMQAVTGISDSAPCPMESNTRQ